MHYMIKDCLAHVTASMNEPSIFKLRKPPTGSNYYELLGDIN